MFELRVLSGLHRGAALPLIGDEWVVGAADDADLAMFDPGICAHHVRVSRAEETWTLDVLDGRVMDRTGQVLPSSVDLALHSPFSVAGVWLCVVPADAAWPDEDALDEAAHLGTASGEVIEPSVVAPRPSWPKRIAIAFGVVTIASSAWALTSQSDAPAAQQTAAPSYARAKLPLDDEAVMRHTLERMLQERELSADVRIEIQGDRLVLVGTLPGQKLPVLARMIERFHDRYDTAIGIQSDVRERQVQLPFQIVQIVGGKHGHVVTSTGRRLFLGDQVDGLRLTAIENDRVSFEGDQRYQVSW